MWATNERSDDAASIPNTRMSGAEDDPVPLGLVLGLEDAFRVLEGIEDALLELIRQEAAPGQRDELATVIRLIHDNLGIDEGGPQ